VTDIKIRKAEREDISQILDIYSYYVTDTAITFEYDVPDKEKFKRRFETVSNKYSYIVAEQNKKIIGYAYADEFIGRKLYDTIEDILYKMGITNLYACIAVPETEDEYLTGNSLDF
jgi:L-amino acid N-acyltransferase YncA